MRPVKIFYQRLIATGNYEHERIGIEIELDEGDTAADALDRAKQFIDCQNTANKKYDADKMQRLTLVVNNPDDYTGAQVKEAQRELDEMSQTDDLPF